jgi:hypothetical protein
MAPVTQSGWVRKFSSSLGFNPGTIQPIASYYANYTTLATPKCVHNSVKGIQYCMMIKRIKYGVLLFYIICANCYMQYVVMTREFNEQQEKQDITSSDKFGKSVHKGAGYTKIHVRHDILISGKLRYPATPLPQRCWIKQFLLYMDDIFCIMAHSLTAFLVCLTLCQIMIS